MATYHEDGIEILDSKYPTDKADYGWDYTEFLAQFGDDDTLATADITNDRGIDVDGPNKVVEDTRVFVWIEGGAEGNTYLITCDAQTTNGRKKKWSFYLPVGKDQPLPDGVTITS